MDLTSELCLLGRHNRTRLTSGPLDYYEAGRSGPVVVFAHGYLTSALLWRKVVPHLQSDHRCISLMLPFGAHRLPAAPDADLSLSGMAALLIEFLEDRGLEDVTLVGSDTGGASCQIVAAANPARLGRLVLCPSDAYDNVPPLVYRYLKLAARVPGAMFALMHSLRIRPIRRLPIAFRWLAKRPIERVVLDAYLEPARTDAAIRRDLIKVTRGLSPDHVAAAGPGLRSFAKPVLLAWAREDKLFPFEHAQRLAQDFGDATVEPIDDAYAFVSEDQPQRLATLIRSFVEQSRSTHSEVN